MVSHFFFEEQTVIEREGEEEEEEEEEGKEQRYGSLGFCMEKLWILVWNVWNLCMELWMGVYVFVWENQTINPFFDEFGSKRTLLGILVVFWIWVG